MKPNPRKANKRNQIAERVNQIGNQSKSRIKKMRDADVAAGQKAMNSQKASIAQRSGGTQKGYRTPAQVQHDYAYAGKDMAHAQAVNAMVGYDSRGGAETLDHSATGKLVKASKRKAIRNKNRSKQAVQSDKKRFSY